MSKSNPHNLHSKTDLPVTVRAALSIWVPILLAALTAVLLPPDTTNSGPLAIAPIFAVLGITSWFMGLLWYGLSQMGLRGQRPLFSSIGFAVLLWITFLLFRFIFVKMEAFGRGGIAGQTFIYLLLFEAFAVQIWAFGLVFRTLAEWRGALTAAFASGILFGMVAYLLFQESFNGSVSSLLYFLLWGILYGIIRLRTGSILGMVLVQSLQSFTAWTVLYPEAQPAPEQLQSLYLAVSVVYLIILWRLWPKQESDYRV
ncbi:MAG: CPBP family intramembrane metalloprotease [Ardenticatenaceae bacterium]|nr:CPBP family intramembrane metalloprotease [Anaerolineales bacterium]MCB8921484.1 CPBP family intramembrane metalloprotease [Ardenticatenaceae bacterium]MCB8990891.1 CPBP family intramembrane metalloprotease [Ardenticatenaceae bacterium]MCB9004958.1 CPBP family intramembrane metalloprotease [Ardenticatenaceae bacterium]